MLDDFSICDEPTGMGEGYRGQFQLVFEDRLAPNRCRRIDPFRADD
jgi:hypothetical protein